jgi:hypothetical protein
VTSAGSRRNRDRAYQRDLQDRGEHCSVDAARLATIGRAVGQQVRVLLSGDAFGLYTGERGAPEGPDTTVRMGGRGRERLGTSDEFSCASRLALWTGGTWVAVELPSSHRPAVRNRPFL